MVLSSLPTPYQVFSTAVTLALSLVVSLSLMHQMISVQQAEKVSLLFISNSDLS